MSVTVRIFRLFLNKNRDSRGIGLELMTSLLQTETKQNGRFGSFPMEITHFALN